MSTTEKTPVKRMSVEELVAEANHWHGEVIGSLRTSLLAARNSGAALLRLKSRVGKHGEWQRWVGANFAASYETAATYMRIAKSWKWIEPEVKNDPKFTLERALRLLRVARDPSKKPADKERDLIRGELKETLANHLDEMTEEEIDWLRQSTEIGINRVDDALVRLREAWRTAK